MSRSILSKDQWRKETEDMALLSHQLERCAMILEARTFSTWKNRRHALAALCLHEQSFGFCHEDVFMLRAVADYQERDESPKCADDLRRLAALIESFLPELP